MWRCQEKQYAVVREKFLTKKNEELRKESRFTQTMLLLQRSEELITCGMRETGKRMKFLHKTVAEKMRGEMGDESGGTDLEQVSLSLEKDANPKKQHTLTENTEQDLWCGRTDARSTRRCHWLLLQTRE